MIQNTIYLALILISFIFTPFLGKYMAAIFSGRIPFLYYEMKVFRFFKIVPQQEMDWKEYLKQLLLFNLYGFLFLLVLQLIQQWLPLNPQNLPMVPFWTAFNTAASFVTNTNWQGYAGETTLSYFTQMLGLTVQNFLSAATGLCALVAFIRGLTGKSKYLGNFHVDLTRAVIYLLLPISILFTIVLSYEGVIQNFSSYIEYTTLEGENQILPMGPVASQEAIKMIGSNGGGFFNVNSAHPFENPTFVTNLLETIAITFIPISCVFMYGNMIHRPREARTLFYVMITLWLIGLLIADAFQKLPTDALFIYPPLEGIETRFIAFKSLLWSTMATATSNGGVNMMLSSLAPISGGICLLNLLFGEVLFGGVGVGLIAIIMYVLLTVFIAGLMVGRTPEYLGKKIEKNVMRWVIVAILFPTGAILIGTGIFILVPAALSSIANHGPHGLTEILYAFSSSAANNGSSFAGLDASTDLYNGVLGLVMLCTRLAVIVSALAIAGLLCTKKTVPITAGTFRTSTPLFGILLACIILIFGGLSFFPALTLGPIVEQIAFMEGRTF